MYLQKYNENEHSQTLIEIVSFLIFYLPEVVSLVLANIWKYARRVWNLIIILFYVVGRNGKGCKIFAQIKIPICIVDELFHEALPYENVLLADEGILILDR